MTYLNELLIRPRRNRKSAAIRALIQETKVHVSDLIYPIFLTDGKSIEIPIESMPKISRLSLDLVLKEAEIACKLCIPAIALFPVIDKRLKDAFGSEALNPKGILLKCIQTMKTEFPELCIIADVALDPYTSHGHDGIVSSEGDVLNDETVKALVQMAILQAEAGIDVVAPSDMMDGRIKAIRKGLDERGFQKVTLLSYAIKYHSAFYAPFREALSSSPAFGDKKTYQMNPANKREALREALIDVEEGADILMIKPALPYLDIIQKIREMTHLPIAAYQVSGEYAMLMAAHQKGWLNGEKAMLESLIAIKRAGADMIFTYFAKEAARLIVDSN